MLWSLAGYKVNTGDAKGAYTQALLLGVETWVTLPENRQPVHWKGKFHRPVVKLVLALYGPSMATPMGAASGKHPAKRSSC